MEKRHGVARGVIAKDCVYWSHETFTCAQGGCAKAETDALARAFGEAGKADIMLANTKGFTGHPMSVGIEGETGGAWSVEADLPPACAQTWLRRHRCSAG